MDEKTLSRRSLLAGAAVAGAGVLLHNLPIEAQQTPAPAAPAAPPVAPDEPWKLPGAPTTAVGLVAGGLTLLTGGRVQRRLGTLEFHGGFSRWFLASRMVRAAAMTLGHVVIARDAATDPVVQRRVLPTRCVRELGPDPRKLAVVSCNGVGCLAHRVARWQVRERPVM